MPKKGIFPLGTISTQENIQSISPEQSEQKQKLEINYERFLKIICRKLEKQFSLKPFTLNFLKLRLLDFPIIFVTIDVNNNSIKIEDLKKVLEESYLILVKLFLDKIEELIKLTKYPILHQEDHTCLLIQEKLYYIAIYWIIVQLLLQEISSIIMEIIDFKNINTVIDFSTEKNLTEAINETIKEIIINEIMPIIQYYWLYYILPLLSNLQMQNNLKDILSITSHDEDSRFTLSFQLKGRKYPPSIRIDLSPINSPFN